MSLHCQTLPSLSKLRTSIPFNFWLLISTSPVGAGDTFTAGALYVLALQPHLSVLKALRLGVLVAGKKIQHEGFEAFRDTSALKKRVSACLAVDNGRP